MAEDPAARVDPAAIVDAAAQQRVVVFGSLPPAGRDLDLLVADDDVPLLGAALAAAGFRWFGRSWIRLADCTAAQVEVHAASSWPLPAEERERLFAEARPLPGRTRLARPAPHHVLLLLAERLVQDGSLTERRQARLDLALAEDVGAWDVAAARADAWGAAAALRLLRAGGPVSKSARAGALAGAGLRGRAAAWRRVLRPPRAAAVITLSGVDGSGKSTQAQALVDALERLGRDSEVVWSRVAYDPWLVRVAAPVKRLRPSRAGASDAAVPDDHSSRRVDPAWALVTALLAVARVRRELRAPRRRGAVVVCDRFVLDSAVHLRERFGSGRSARAATAVVRRLSPRPAVALWLDVDAELAYARKPEEHSVRRLRAHAEAYRELHARLGVRRVDGTRPLDQLCAEVAADVVRALDAG